MTIIINLITLPGSDVAQCWVLNSRISARLKLLDMCCHLFFFFNAASDIELHTMNSLLNPPGGLLISSTSKGAFGEEGLIGERV